MDNWQTLRARGTEPDQSVRDLKEPFERVIDVVNPIQMTKVTKVAGCVVFNMPLNE